jgi:hypothetical protein
LLIAFVGVVTNKPDARQPRLCLCRHQQTQCSPPNRYEYQPIKWLNKPNSSSSVSENFEGGSRSLLKPLL